MLLNLKQSNNSDPVSIRIGDTDVKQESSAKLLGITFSDNQKWKSQLQGKILCNQKTNNSISKDNLKTVTDEN